MSIVREKTRQIALIGASALLVALCGCMAPMQKATLEESAAAADDAQAVRQELQSEPESLFSVTDAVYLGGGNPIALPVQDGRETVLDAPINMERGHLLTLQQIAELIQSLRGVRVNVTPDALIAAAGGAPDPFDSEGTDGAGGAGGVPALGVGQNQGAIRVSYNGTLRGLLDEVTSRTGNYWDWVAGGIVISHFQTKTYRIAAIPGTTGVTGRLGNSSQSGSAGGGGGDSGGSGGAAGGTTSSTSEQETTVSAEIDIIGPIAETVRSMLGAGGQMSLTGGLGLITVTDVPAIQERVRTYIETVNEVATRQVVIDVSVVSVELSNGEAYGIDWNIVRRSINGLTESGFNAFSASPQDANTASFAVIDPAYNYAGTNVVLHALSSQGTVKVDTSAAVVTLTNQPAPINDTDEITYLARVESTTIPESGAVQLELTPAVVSTGLAMQLLPVILDNDDVLLQFSTSISSLRELRTVTGGGSAVNGSRIEAPNTGKRNTLQNVRLRSGQTLALWGFDRTSSRNDSRGIGRPDLMLAGGGTNTNRTRTVLVILVTPRVLV